MKLYSYIIIVGLLLASCGIGKNSISVTAEDKALVSLIKKLEKDPSNTELKTSLTSLYNDAAKSHLDKIEIYNSLTAVDKWDKIVREYNSLKHLSDIDYSSSSVAKLLNTPAYVNELQTAKQNGAAAYYESGISALSNNDRTSARLAYNDFKKANYFVPGYKNVKQQMDIAFESSIIKVVVNPVIIRVIY